MLQAHVTEHEAQLAQFCRRDICHRRCWRSAFILLVDVFGIDALNRSRTEGHLSDAVH
jgi:hypothetical protein